MFSTALKPTLSTYTTVLTCHGHFMNANIYICVFLHISVQPQRFIHHNLYMYLQLVFSYTCHIHPRPRLRSTSRSSSLFSHPHTHISIYTDINANHIIFICTNITSPVTSYLNLYYMMCI